MNNELDNKTAVLQKMTEAEYLPMTTEINLSIEKSSKIPLDKVAAMGVAFNPLLQAVQSVTTGSGGSGIYFVNTHGKQMFTKSGTNKYIGSLKNAQGLVGGGQATMTQLACDPMMICMAAVLMSVEKKLDDICEIQKDIMQYLEQKEKAKLQGNLNILSDILNNYKYNFNNEKYKTNKHIQVQEIKRNAEQSILFYREQIGAKIRKRKAFHADQDVNVILEKLQSQFRDYQLALYLYSFSGFVEVMLLENFDSGYICSVSDSIEEHSFQYRKLYTDCYNLLEEYSKSSIQANLVKGLSKASKLVGNTISKVPVIGQSQLDESLIESGEKLKKYLTNRPDKAMKKLAGVQDNVVLPFVENLKTIDTLYNKETQYFFDEENIYFLPGTE